MTKKTVLDKSACELNDFFIVKEAKIQSVTPGVKSQCRRERCLSEGAKIFYCTAAPTESTHSMHGTRQNGDEKMTKMTAVILKIVSFKIP